MTADPITRIYAHAEALRTIAAQLTEDHGGLALIMHLMADDIDRCGSDLDGPATSPSRILPAPGHPTPQD